MDRLEHYRQSIQTLLERHGETMPHKDEVETALCFDPLRDRGV